MKKTMDSQSFCDALKDVELSREIQSAIKFHRWNAAKKMVFFYGIDFSTRCPAFTRDPLRTAERSYNEVTRGTRGGLDKGLSSSGERRVGTRLDCSAQGI